MSETVLSVSSRAFMLACERLGVPRAQLLAAAELDQAVLLDPDGRLRLEQVGALWRAAYRLTGAPQLALLAAEGIPFGAYRVIDYLVANAPTVGEGLRKLATYFPIINTGVEISVCRGEYGVAFEFHPCRGHAATLAYAEYSLAACYLRTQQASGVPFPLRVVEFAFPSPTDTAVHRRVFGCDLRFDAPVSRWLMSEDAFDAPAVGPSADLYAVLDAHAAGLRNALTTRDPFMQTLRRAIELELPSHGATLEDVARGMGMGARTLQRRLREHGKTFSEVLDETRDALARAYLHGADGRRNVSISEVAFLLGFANASSFHRAFKRWAGQTPAAWREGA